MIKCSGECAIVDGCLRLAGYGFTVRCGHRIGYRESGVISREVAASAEAAKQESVRRAVAWLGAQSPSGGRVIIRCDGQDLAWQHTASALRHHGWDVEPEYVAPEAVSEAAALARRAVLPVLRMRGVVSRAAWESVSVQPAPVMYGPVVPAPVPAINRLTDAVAEAVIICDGGYKPPPYRLATYACLVWAGAELAHRESGVVCWGRAAHSHVAELAATVAALRWLVRSPLAEGTRVQLRSDNHWVVTALTSRLRRRPLPGTVMLLRTVDRLLSRLSRNGCEVAIRQVPRKQVAQADALCRKVCRDRLAGAGARNPRQPLKAFLRPASTEWQSRV